MGVGVPGRSLQTSKYSTFGDFLLIFHHKFHHQKAASAYFGHFLTSLAPPQFHIGPALIYGGREADLPT